MAMGQLGVVLRHLRNLIGGPPAEDQSDRRLLERFARLREEEAFAALVHKHGPMVLGVCRRVLGNLPDAEDAFQATFLVLARKAGSLGQQGTLAGWLYTVARHTALKARARAARRRAQERQVAAMPPRPPHAEESPGELRALLDAELGRLPEKYRLPLVLCYLEGQTNEEAARTLGWPSGTVKGRLARARELLRSRLARRGVSLSGAALAAALASEAGAAAVPAALAAATVRGAVLLAAGTALSAADIPAPVAELVKGVRRTMLLNKIKTVVVLGLLVLGIGLAGQQLLFSRPAEADGGGTKPAESAASGKLSDKARKLAEQLKANLGSFSLRVWFLGAAKEPYQTVQFQTFPPKGRFEPPHWGGTVIISKEEASRLIDHLAAAGFLDRARPASAQELNRLAQPSYLLSVGAHQYPAHFEDLGWGPNMLRRLDGLRKVLSGDAAKLMDKVLKPFGIQRELWKRGADLKKHLGKFALVIDYFNPGGRRPALPSLVLRCSRAEQPEDRLMTVVPIDRAQAARLIDYLSAAHSPPRQHLFGGPMVRGYFVYVRPSTPKFNFSFPLGSPFTALVMDLRRELGGDAARALDHFLKKLEPERKLWPGGAEGDQVSDWGKKSDGLSLRVEAPTALEQGMPLGVFVEARGDPQKLPPKVKQLDAFYPAAFLELVLTDRATRTQLTLKALDPTRGFPAQDVGRKAVPLDGTLLKPWPAIFPLVELRDVIKPGAYDAQVRFTFPAAPTKWWRGTAAEWDRAGFWHGTALSGTFRLEVRKETPKTRTFLLPKTLRLLPGLVVGYTAKDAGPVTLPVRNGYTVGVRYLRDGEVFAYSTSPPPPGALREGIDRWAGRNSGDRKVNYTIEVFETTEPPTHKWQPGPGSGHFKVLWKKSFTVAATGEEIRKLGATPGPRRKGMDD